MFFVSVDYVVHLANAYLESTEQGREERLSFVETFVVFVCCLGVSVASGAVTTFLSGYVLYCVFFYI